MVLRCRELAVGATVVGRGRHSRSGPDSDSAQSCAILSFKIVSTASLTGTRERRSSRANREGEIDMNVHRNLLVLVTLAAASPASGQQAELAAGQSIIGQQSAASIPDFSGIWTIYSSNTK